jgi:hypothetical protein
MFKQKRVGGWRGQGEGSGNRDQEREQGHVGIWMSGEEGKIPRTDGRELR